MTPDELTAASLRYGPVSALDLHPQQNTSKLFPEIVVVFQSTTQAGNEATDAARAAEEKALCM